MSCYALSIFYPPHVKLCVSNSSCNNRVQTSHGKPESRGISFFHFPGLESHEIEVWVLENYGKVL